MRRYRPEPVDPPTEHPTFEVEMEYRHRDFGWFQIALMMVFNAGMGYYAYTQKQFVVFFPGDAKWLFWGMTAITLWIIIDKLIDDDEKGEE